MSFQSLIAHNGVNHQQSSPTEKTKQSPTEAQHDDIKHNSNDSQTVTPGSNSASEKQVLETPETKLDTERKTESLTSTETSNLDAATLVTGFGESIFTLLIASPFLLIGLKKWLHK
ncbi:hypothetical protein [Myxosarcina sp. GI1]|uniref:hypothetical protein n=1 Tax=Myxosarcina sp. GI1 TaxID=1541065 RepID=UPI0005659435|nr:hypothetical protein [Myxosarcina sp. GI1]